METKIELEKLVVGDCFKEYSNSKYSPLYTVRKIENSEVYADSSVTCGSVVKIREVYKID